MTSKSQDKAAGNAPTRRAILRAGLGGAAVAGVATAALATPALAVTARPRMPASPASAGSAAGFNWSGWASTAPGMVTNNAMACLSGSFGGTIAGSSLWLFATGTDGRIFFNTSSDAQNWSGWTEVPGGGRTNLGPSAGIGPNGQLVLSVTGTDNAVYLNSTTNGSNWTGWFSLGGQTFAAPLLAEPALHAYAVGTDNAIYVNSTTDLQNFSGWNQVPGGGRTTIAMCLNGFNFSGVGGVDALFAVGTNNHIFYNAVDSDGPISPSILGHWTEVPGGGMTDAAPTVAGFSDFIDALLFVKGFQDQRIFVNLASGYPNFGNWEEVPGGGLTNVALCATGFFSDFGTGPILLFAVGTDGRPYLNMTV